MHAHAAAASRRRLGLVVWTVLVGLALSPGPARAQEREPERPWRLQPVFSQNAVDGLLLGLKGSYELFGVRPEAALGYGLSSGRLRYRAGLGWKQVLLQVYDWPDSPLLGRTGERGLALVLGRGERVASLASVQAWTVEDEADAPPVRYVYGRTHYRWDGPFDLSLSLMNTITLGTVVGRGPFQSQERQIQARWGDLRLSWADGTLNNAAALPAFAFSQAIRGDEAPLRGESYWHLKLERRVLLLSFPVELPELPVPLPGPAADLLKDLVFRVEASTYGEALSVRPVPSAVEPDLDLSGPQSRLGWAVGLVFSLGKFEFRVDLFFNDEGQMTHLFG